ncbi:hypothetical protein ACJJTC_019563 [Scirpophaga incertulas]
MLHPIAFAETCASTNERNSFYSVTWLMRSWDIYIDIAASSLGQDTEEYLNTMAYHGLLPSHNLTTRNLSCLDHVVLKSPQPAVTLVIQSSVTDHNAVLVAIDSKSKHRAIKIISKLNYDELERHLLDCDFSSILTTKDPNIAADRLVDALSTAITSHTTSTSVARRQKIEKPWITPGLLRSIRNRDSMHKRLRITPDNEILKITYLRYRNYCNKLLKKIKGSYDTQLIRDAGTNSKQLWKAIKEISNTPKSQNGNQALLACQATAKESVDCVNLHFSNVGKQLAEAVLNQNSHNARLSRLGIVSLTRFHLKSKVTQYLQNLSYLETEDLMVPIK